MRANEREAFMMRIDYERTDDRIERLITEVDLDV